VFISIQDIPTLGAFKVEDCQAFQQRLTDPAPDWKPFRKALSFVGPTQAMAKVQALFQYLVDVDYLAGNPWKPVKALTQDRVKGQDHQDQAVRERELPIEVIHTIKGYFEQAKGSAVSMPNSLPAGIGGGPFFVYGRPGDVGLHSYSGRYLPRPPWSSPTSVGFWGFPFHRLQFPP